MTDDLDIETLTPLSAAGLLLRRADRKVPEGRLLELKAVAEANFAAGATVEASALAAIETVCG